jgi:hypothetical protein
MRLVELEKDFELLAANDVVGERIAEGWMKVDDAPPAVKAAIKAKEKALLKQVELARRKPES